MGLSMLPAQLYDRIFGVPANRRDPEERFRAELVIGFALFEIAASGLFSISEFFWGTTAIAGVFGVTTLLLVGAMACVVIYIAWLLLRMAWHLLCELWRRCRH